MDVWTQSGHMSVVEFVVGIHVFTIQFLKLLCLFGSFHMKVLGKK